VAALNHPTQQKVCTVISNLISDLRSLKTDQDYYEFQGRLFANVHEAELLQWEAKRTAEREKRGKSVPKPLAATWDLELIVMDRVVRQLKTVGDALAWRRFKYRRPPIIALSRAEGGGPIVHKEGLPYELGRVTSIWKETRHFALLNGLTNCIRLADVTEFAGDQITLHEVKKDPSRTDPKQVRRLNEVALAINEGAPLATSAGMLQLWMVRTQLRTRIRTDLQRGISMARRDGVAVVPLGKGWSLACASAGGWPRSSESAAEVAAELGRVTENRVETNLVGSAHRFQLMSIDQVGRAGYYAPFSVYPLSPTDCAQLTCDYLIFRSVLTSDRIESALSAGGFSHVACLATPASDVSSGDQPMFRMVYGNRLIQLSGTAVAQMLLEFIDPKLYSQALMEAQSLSNEQAVSHSISFANERGVWR